MTPRIMLLAAAAAALAGAAAADTIRIATFNASMNRNAAGELRADLESGTNQQLRTIAEIIQRVDPDVLLINEFDYEAAGDLPALFNSNYLNIGQNVSGAGPAAPVDYAYSFTAPSNTGVASGFDLDNNGSVGGPNDAKGFGFFEGQFGMAVFSKYEIDAANARTFQNFLWKDMPGARLPVDPADGAAWYSDEDLAVLPLSSKSHWDLPVIVGGETVHLLASHPTPPVFDGPEDRNGLRNADEIRFWADYVNGEDYFYDDLGGLGGLGADAKFVIVGDLNSDPVDGDSLPGAAQQLLDDPLVNTSLTPGSEGGVDAASRQGGANLSHVGDPFFDTADFADSAPGNLRADYVLPSATLDLIAAGVFWPKPNDPLFALAGDFPFPSSDHRLVWVDVAVSPAPIPLPAAAWLLLGGLGALGLAGRRRA
ncbi:endonuclease/exonuclease/phosphatase family protein [Rubrimonas cliftonensis]|uniref:3-phytase/alkaline phosphatase D n=1 Tax=Rubrimonas cliftonensis TaxID=89524 RepID=A0A1H3YYT7_9RHOB|nr:endonuclease/exonuclease/phosphatase family protein [Rubrimonas cliftonensis]SEA16590.1 3-phytase/alkaline phosphatase D [Rubrimonas cliftonensis]